MDVDRYHQFEMDNHLSSDVIEKYKVAAEICNGTFYIRVTLESLKSCIAACAPGVYLADICIASDNFIAERTKRIYTKTERGIAFPTCISVNNVIQNFSPHVEMNGSVRSDPCMRAGDVVKIELGVHIDGYVCTSGHTVVIPEAGQPMVTGRKADVACAAFYAAECAARLIRPGRKISEVSAAIQRIAKSFECQPIAETASFNIQRFIFEGDKRIPNLSTDKMLATVQDFPFEDAEFEVDQVYAVNIFMSSNKGIPREHPDYSPQVFQRDANRVYHLKLKAARSALSDVTNHFSVFPFASRDLFALNATNKFGLNECLEKRVVVPLPVLEEKGAFTAQFKFTLLLTRSGAVRLTEGMPLPQVHSEYSLDASGLGDFVRAPVAEAEKMNIRILRDVSEDMLLGN